MFSLSRNRGNNDGTTNVDSLEGKDEDFFTRSQDETIQGAKKS
jgi:hypothetical protein